MVYRVPKIQQRPTAELKDYLKREKPQKPKRVRRKKPYRKIYTIYTNSQRLRVLRLLVEERMSLTEIATATGIKRSTVLGMYEAFLKNGTHLR